MPTDYDTDYRIDILLPPESVDTLKHADVDHPVFEDLVDTVSDPQVIQNRDGINIRHTLDAIVSPEGMAALDQATEHETTALADLCGALVEVAEPAEDGGLLIQFGDTGRQIHAFSPDFNPLDEEYDDDDTDTQSHDPLGQMLDEMRVEN